MLVLGLILAALAALLHVYIFWMESLAWEGPTARRTFGISSDDEARFTKPLAFNQGFYNLFLAILVLGGVVAVPLGARLVGLTLVFSGAGCMLAAALVLLLSSREHRGAAIKQGLIPLLAVVCTAVGVALTYH
jgi:putative membrane protein